MVDEVKLLYDSIRLLASIVNEAGRKTLGSHARSCPVPVGLLEDAQELMRRAHPWSDEVNGETEELVRTASQRVL